MDRLKEDMIINASDGEDAMNARMFALKTKYLDSLAVNPNNSSANLGAAAAQTYLYMVYLNKEIKNFVNYVKTGGYKKRTGHAPATAPGAKSAADRGRCAPLPYFWK